MRGPKLRSGPATFALFAVTGLLHGVLFYPGTMDWDSAIIAKQAATGVYEDWFSPVFTQLWRLTDHLGSNPGSLWVIQTALALGGACLIADALRRIVGIGAALMLWMSFTVPPLPYLFREITKDTFMIAALLTQAGVAAYLATTAAATASGARARQIGLAIPASLATAALVFITRPNAVVASLPLLFFSTAVIMRGRLWRALVLTTFGTALIVLTVRQYTREVLRPLPRPAVTALMTFDLAGITHYAGRTTYVGKGDTYDVTCYTPWDWDTLIGKECGSLGRYVWFRYTDERESALREWSQAIAGDWPAYATHRGRYMLYLLRIACHDCADIGASLYRSDANPPSATVRTSALTDLYEDAARASFIAIRPWMLLVVLTGLLVASLRSAARDGWRDPLPILTATLTGSAMCYALAYALVGIGSDFRYVSWLYVATPTAIIVQLVSGVRRPFPYSATPLAVTPVATSKPRHFG